SFRAGMSGLCTLTAMINMRAFMVITVSGRCDSKVSLDPIHLQAPIDPAASLLLTPQERQRLQFCLAELALPGLREDLVHLVLSALNVHQSVRTGIIERRVILREDLAGENTVHGCVLNIDMQSVARHGDSDIEVDLHRVADPL